MNDTSSAVPLPPSNGFETDELEPTTCSPTLSHQSDADPTIHQSNTAPLLLPPRRRRSSITRLPKATRDLINQMLDDGYPYAAICQHLRQQGIDLSDDSIARWKKGGYQDYLRELHLLDVSRLRYELTLDLARQQRGIDVFQAAHKIAAAQICEAVAEIGSDSLREAVKLNPLNLLRMLNSLSRLTAGALKCERHLFDQADHAERDRPPEERVLRPETLARIEKELRLL